MADERQSAAKLGRSLGLVGGDLILTAGDFEEVAGRENFLQSLRVMIETPTATDVFNVGYGFDVVGILGAPQTVSLVKDLVRLNLVKSLSLDDRVREIKEIVFDDEPRFFEISRAFTPEGSRQSRKGSRRWQAVVVLQTVEAEDVTLNLEGRGR